MKILYVGNYKHVFINSLANEILKYGHYVKGFSSNMKEYDFKQNIEIDRSVLLNYAQKIGLLRNFAKFCDFKRNIERFSREFDIINFHFNYASYIEYKKVFLSKKAKIVMTIYGSDFYKSSDNIKELQRCIYDKCDIITFANEETRGHFLDFYGAYEEKSRIVRFGLKLLDTIDRIEKDEDKEMMRIRLGIKKRKMIICCGYNSFENQNHIKIIAELVSLPEEVKKKLFFIFPMTYGNDSYRERVAKILSKTDLEYKIFDEFMTDDTMARVRLISDVMIHLPDTDQFSASMQEHIYAGSTVITGNWLPYGIFTADPNIDIIQISNTNELKKALLNTIKRGPVVTTYGKKVIRKISGWNSTINGWINVYQESMTNK